MAKGDGKGGGKQNNQPAKTTSNAGLAGKLDSLLSRIPKGTFASVGGKIGGPLGAAAGKAMSTITGYGDYRVSHNSLINQTLVGEMADQVPVFRNQGADTRIKHCEFVMNLSVPENGAAFNSTVLPIDPSNFGTFPWLANVAKKYQRYKVRGMVIGYRSTSTDYNNSGVVAITVNYDPAEDAYQTMEGLLNSKFAVSCKPSVSMLAPVECDPGRSPMDGYYIKHVTSADVTDATIRQTRLGTINVATEGLSLTPGTSIGQIYVSYDIELLYPYMTMAMASHGADISGFAGVLNFTSQAVVDSDVSSYGYGKLAGYGGLPEDKIGFRLIDSPINGSAVKWYEMVFPPGRYHVWCVDAAWTNGTASGVVGGIANTTFFGGSSVNLVSLGTRNQTGDVLYYEYVITVSEGDISERTVSPPQVGGRVQNGTASKYISFSLSIQSSAA